MPLRLRRDALPARAPRVSRLAAFRLGFAALIALLAFAAFEAYRIQDAASRQAADIYERYIRTSDSLARIRRVVLTGSINIRDYFLSKKPERVPRFRNQIEELKRETALALRNFEQASGHWESTRELESMLGEFWESLKPTLKWSEEDLSARAFDFVESEVVPRRNAVAQLLHELSDANEEALRRSDADVARTRQGNLARLLSIMGVSVLLGIVVAHFSLSHAGKMERESLQRFEEVARAKRELEQLSGRLLEIQEDERRRLSRELHDEIGQTLTALRIEISHAQAAWKKGSPEIRERLEQARSLAERTVRTVRDISLLLRPSLLDDLGLGPALQWQAEEFSRRSGVRCEFAEHGLEENLPDTHKTCVYRVVQEALNNCEKHARAALVRVSIAQTAGGLKAEIEDDGGGFENAGGGLGIIGMRERAAKLGGSLAVDSNKDRGTRVTLTLPLPPPSGPEQEATWASKSC